MSFALDFYDYVATIPDALNDEEIELIRKYAESLIPKQAVVGGELADNISQTKKQVRDSEVRWLFPNKKIEWLLIKIKRMIHDLNYQFFHMDVGSCSDIQHTTYAAPSGFYGVHADTFIRDYPHRKISFSILLTDGEEYEGGDLVIYSGSIDKPFIASRKKGSLVAFISLALHEVKPVTKGTRQSLVGWVMGPPLK